ncbi:MAG: hypothetical protein IPL32_15505 [Chloracidobacterium sp.]|nr:hypothetical protein [Chloracidobacterium sp.]
MKNNGKTNCPFEDEIVSYMYDEMVGVERSQFETHLADCTVCTDDFAAISEARFSVFEWQKEEFNHLPTPEIVIPYEPRQKFVEQSESVGLWAGLRGWLQPLPLAAVAGLVLFLGVGFLMLRSTGTSELPIASNVRPNDVPSTAPLKNTETSKQPELDQSDVAVTTPKTTNKDIQPIKAVARRQISNAKQTVATTVRRQPTTTLPSTAPVLSNYEAEDDNSLRLADLFADIDS